MDSFAFETPKDMCVSTSSAKQGAAGSSRTVPTWKSESKEGEVTLVCAGVVPLTSRSFRCLAALAASRWAAYKASSSSLNFSSCKANCA